MVNLSLVVCPEYRSSSLFEELGNIILLLYYYYYTILSFIETQLCGNIEISFQFNPPF